MHSPVGAACPGGVIHTDRLKYRYNSLLTLNPVDLHSII